MADSVLVQSRVRDLVKKRKHDFRLSEDFLESLDVAVGDLINRAVVRADQNGRKTLQPQDL